MMQILAASGVPLLTDNRRRPDKNNPHGYYEFEPVKQLAHNNRWLAQASGKAVKIISILLPHLPASYNYKIIFMERNITEILASQDKMLERQRKRVDPSQNQRLFLAFQSHLAKIKAWLTRQKNMKAIYISYNQLLNHPHVEIAKIGPFLGIPLNVAAMLKVIDPRLYHQRSKAKPKVGLAL